MNGFYNVIKPIGWSSSDAVIKIRGILRRNLGQKVKVGHLGTLDPLATGVLGVAVGSATKLFDYFLKKKKTYIATCTLGKSTTTLDQAGDITKSIDVPSITDESLESVLSSFIGSYDQIPPAFSAKSVNGVRAYHLAQKGKEVELKPCRITIYDCRIVERISNETFRFRVECSGGTYIRSLCRDIGDKLSIPAYMSALERIENGSMRIEEAATIEEIGEDISKGFFSLERFADTLKTVDFSDNNRKAIENGVKQKAEGVEGLCAVSIGGKFYAIGNVIDGLLEIVARDR